MIGNKIALIVTAILVAATAAIGVPLFQDLKSNSRPEEATIAPTETTETEVKPDMPVENNEQQGSSIFTLDNGVVIEITPGVANGKISSPLTIKGTAPNSASKAQIAIRLVDPSGNAIINNSVSSSSSGSSNGSSTFNTTLKFSTSNSGTGSLQISGGGDSISVPVVF